MTIGPQTAAAASDTVPSGLIPARVAGIGYYVPERRLTNADLEKMVNTTDEWIVSRTGIKTRCIAGPDEPPSLLATRAARKALAQTGLLPYELDLILVATSTPDLLFPATACLVQANLGALRAACFDLEAACSGFVYGLVIGHQFIATGLYRNILVIGVDVLSWFVNWQDRSTCVLFGDGAGAVILQASDRPGILGTKLGADGRKAGILESPGGGARYPATARNVPLEKLYLRMSGREVYKFAVDMVPQVIVDVLSELHLRPQEIDFIILHQANQRITEAVAKRLGWPMERMVSNIERYGNTSAASIPIAWAEAVQDGRIQPGHRLLLVGFGGGLTWGAVVVEW